MIEERPGLRFVPRVPKGWIPASTGITAKDQCNILAAETDDVGIDYLGVDADLVHMGEPRLHVVAAGQDVGDPDVKPHEIGTTARPPTPKAVRSGVTEMLSARRMLRPPRMKMAKNPRTK